jgi:hypothetical protein
MVMDGSSGVDDGTISTPPGTAYVSTNNGPPSLSMTCEKIKLIKIKSQNPSNLTFLFLAHFNKK